MSLFTINRYMGDGAEGHNKNSAAQIIEQLNRRACVQKKVKTCKLTASEHLEGEIDSSKTKSLEANISKRKPVELSPPPSKKKKKKRKLASETLSEDCLVSDIGGLARNAAAADELLSNGNSQKIRKVSVVKGEHPDSVADDDDDESGFYQMSSNEDGDEMVATADADDVRCVSADPGCQGRAEVGGFTVIGDIKQKTVEKVQRVLPGWLAKPTVIADDIRHCKVPLDDVHVLDAELIRQLKDNSITHLFPVQNVVIPELLGGRELSHVTSHMGGHVTGVAGYYPNDICCSAPTGSGKTLAFVLPIVQMLKQRVVCHVRALVVLPVQDLASQVYKVFQAYCKGTKLKVALIVGQKPFASEQRTLVRKSLRGYSSQVDIVVATPGRLVDHISQTEGFQLAHLRYLVIDEADRMMDEIKHDWLSQVEGAVYASGRRHPIGSLTVDSADRMQMPLQKMLFSATLSQNPEKLQQLKLFQPHLYTSIVTATTKTATGHASSEKNGGESQSIESRTSEHATEFVGKYTTPSGLTEYFIQSSVGEKPLHVLHLLHHLKFRHVLCFTNSVESTHRLSCLVRLVGGLAVEEISSNLHAAKRARILQKFAAGKIDMLICSDSMSRGMDVQGVQCVVSYEMPPHLKTYIHRVGRTARAGRVGTAITLLEKKQIFHFKKMLQEAGKTDVKELKYPRSQLKPLLGNYKRALDQLPDLIKEEKRMKKL